MKVARTSEYDGLIEALLNNTEKGLTTREITELVGCSGQKGFVYIRDHKDELVELGKNERGAMTYVGKGNALAASGKPAGAGKRGRGRPKGSVNKARASGASGGTVAVAPAPAKAVAPVASNGNGHATVTPIRKASAVEVGVVMTLVRLVLDDGVLVTWEAADGRQITGTLNV